MYTVTFMGKTSKVSAALFWSLALPVLLVFLGMVGYFCLMVYLSTTMLQDYTNVSAVLWGVVLALVLSSITVNGQEKAFFHKRIRTGLGFALILWTIWYQYSANNCDVMNVWLLAVPVIASVLYRLGKSFFTLASSSV